MVESFISTLPIPVVLFTADAPLKPKYSHKGSIPAGIEPLWEYLGLSGASAVNKTTGMGRVEINDSTINYVANSGSDSYNLTLTSTGTVSKGLFEIFRPTISGNGWPTVSRNRRSKNFKKTFRNCAS